MRASFPPYRRSPTKIALVSGLLHEEGDGLEDDVVRGQEQFREVLRLDATEDLARPRMIPIALVEERDEEAGIDEDHLSSSNP
jgi:hypothetical protein